MSVAKEFRMTNQHANNVCDFVCEFVRLAGLSHVINWD